MELLAPAGSIDSFNAALAAGADAVYLGLPWFNARQPARNFTPEDLKEAISRAHKQGVKVFITMNTDLKSEELEQAAKVLSLIRELKADAVIIKDFGLFSLAKKAFPELTLHLSTQFGVANSLAAIQAKKMGAERVIPARELNFDELKAMTEAPGAPEVEAFVQGSMCFSFSGKCLLSSWVGGKSANRGLCQAPCRLKYKCGDKEFPFFSMKDMNIVRYLEKLKELNIKSLKIEGRLKSPGWVEKITGIYRKALNGESDLNSALKELEKYSGRESGEGFITGLNNLTAEHNVRFGRFLGRVTDLMEKEGENYAVVNFTKKSDNTSLRFVSEDDRFLTIVHKEHGELIPWEEGFSLIKNIGKIEKEALVYEVIPSRTAASGIGKKRYDVELEIQRDDLIIRVITDSGSWEKTEKYKKVVKAKRGVYPDAVYDKLMEKSVNGWRFNKLYCEEMLLSKTQVNSIEKAVSHILAVSVTHWDPLKDLKLPEEAAEFLEPSLQGERSPKGVKSVRIRADRLHKEMKEKHIIIDEMNNSPEQLHILKELARGREITIALYPINFEKDIQELHSLVQTLEETIPGLFYEVNDIGHVELLSRLNVPSDKMRGGQGVAAYNYLTARYLKEELGLTSVSLPLELNSRAIEELTEKNRNYVPLRFTTLARVPVMYSRAQSEIYEEGTMLQDKIGTEIFVHKFRELNVFMSREFYSSQECQEMKELQFDEYISDRDGESSEPSETAPFNLCRRLW